MTWTWLTIFGDWLGASRYAAHSICLTNDPVAVFSVVATNGAISLAYKAIGIGLFIAFRNPAYVYNLALIVLKEPFFIRLFSGFILWCSFTHDAENLTMFFGVYYLMIFVNLVTAIVSVATAARMMMIAWRPERYADVPSMPDAVRVDVWPKFASGNDKRKG